MSLCTVSGAAVGAGAASRFLKVFCSVEYVVAVDVSIVRVDVLDGYC